MRWMCLAAAPSQGTPHTWHHACQAPFAQLERPPEEVAAVPSKDSHLSTASWTPSIPAELAGLVHRPMVGLLCHGWWHLATRPHGGYRQGHQDPGGSSCPGAAAQRTPLPLVSSPKPCQDTGREGMGTSLTQGSPHLPLTHICAAAPAPPPFHHHLSGKEHGSASHCPEPEGRWDPQSQPHSRAAPSILSSAPGDNVAPVHLQPQLSGPPSASPQLQPSAQG